VRQQCCFGQACRTRGELDINDILVFDFSLRGMKFINRDPIPNINEVFVCQCAVAVSGLVDLRKHNNVLQCQQITSCVSLLHVCDVICHSSTAYMASNKHNFSRCR
jgi:hypothetical protein